jgi:hypothetical protein
VGLDQVLQHTNTHRISSIYTALAQQCQDKPFKYKPQYKPFTTVADNTTKYNTEHHTSLCFSLCVCVCVCLCVLV